MNKSKFLIIKLGQNKLNIIYTDLGKYEYLTGEDLGYKPDVVQKAKCEYSPLGQVFNKGLKTDEKEEGLLKRLKNIEDKTDNQSRENKDNQLGIESVIYMVNEELLQKAKNMTKELASQEKFIDYQNLYLKGGNNTEYGFKEHRSLKELFKAIYYRNIRRSKAERIQDEFDGIYGALKLYRPKKKKKTSKAEIF